MSSSVLRGVPAHGERSCAITSSSCGQWEQLGGRHGWQGRLVSWARGWWAACDVLGPDPIRRKAAPCPLRRNPLRRRLPTGPTCASAAYAAPHASAHMLRLSCRSVAEGSLHARRDLAKIELALEMTVRERAGGWDAMRCHVVRRSRHD